MVSHLPDNEKDLKPPRVSPARSTKCARNQSKQIFLSNYDKHRAKQETEVSSLSANKKELKPHYMLMLMFTKSKTNQIKPIIKIFLAPSAGIKQEPSVVSPLSDNEKELKPPEDPIYVHKMSEKSNKTKLSFQL